MGLKAAVNGFGRTGRLAFRAAIEKRSPLDFVAVNRGDAASVGHLLKYDSVTDGRLSTSSGTRRTSSSKANP